MDSWAQLPVEMACQVIGQMSDLQSIVNFQRSSRRFTELVPACLQEVQSETPVVVPIEYFRNYQRLEVVGPKILLSLTPETLDVISTLPRLWSASFYLGTGRYSLDLIEFVEAVLAQIDPSRYAGLNFRFVQGGQSIYGLIVQDGRFMTMGFDMPSDAQLPLEQVVLPPNYRVLSRALREFLWTAHFLGVDPNRDISDTNPSLSHYARQIADAGMVLEDLLGPLFRSYFFDNGVEVGPGNTYRLDEPLQQLLGAVLERRKSSLHPLVIQGPSFRWALQSQLRLENIFDIFNYDIPTGPALSPAATRDIDKASSIRRRLALRRMSVPIR